MGSKTQPPWRLTSSTGRLWSSCPGLVRRTWWSCRPPCVAPRS